MKKMNLTKKSNLKIAAATTMILFSLLACFSGAYAWFISNRSLGSNSNHFKVEVLSTAVQSITFHQYQGTTDIEDGKTYYSFNPSPSGSVTLEGGDVDDDDYEDIALGEYSLENPIHPLLMMFKVSGGTEVISLETDFTYVAQDYGFSLKATVGTYALLEAYNKASLNNGDYLKVTADEKHGGVPTVYQYISAEQSYDMVWIDLNSGDNPLSSVVQFHSFEFTGATLNDIKANKNINSVSTSGINIDTAAFTNSNKSGFVNFTDEETFTYNKEIKVYDGNVVGVTYVGIVIDYNSLALQYIFSKYLGNDILSDGLTFNCDWTTKV